MPTTKTIEVTTYKFGELSGKAKDKARGKLSEWITSDDWWEYVYEDWKEKLEEMGFEDAKIAFSGFWSQGDGACFKCGVDIAKWIKHNKLGNKYRHLLEAAKEGEVGASICTSGRYCHYNTMSIDDQTSYLRDSAGNEWDEVSKMIISDAKAQAQQIYRDLEKEYYAITSDESLEDFADWNDYLFTESGSRCVAI